MMCFQCELGAKPKQFKGRVTATNQLVLLLVLLAVAFVNQGCALFVPTAPPTAEQQAKEVAVLETHVLPVVKNLKATWYLNEGTLGGSLNWQRGNFSTARTYAQADGTQSFDNETAVAYKQLAQAISISRVPTKRLNEARFAADGTVRFASFQRSGGGITDVFTYIYSPGTKPPEWTSKLGPVLLTRIGNSDWWLEQSPDD